MDFIIEKLAIVEHDSKIFPYNNFILPPVQEIIRNSTLGMVLLGKLVNEEMIQLNDLYLYSSLIDPFTFTLFFTDMENLLNTMEQDNIHSNLKSFVDWLQKHVYDICLFFLRTI